MVGQLGCSRTSPAGFTKHVNLHVPVPLENRGAAVPRATHHSESPGIGGDGVCTVVTLDETAHLAI